MAVMPGVCTLEMLFLKEHRVGLLIVSLAVTGLTPRLITVPWPCLASAGIRLEEVKKVPVVKDEGEEKEKLRSSMSQTTDKWKNEENNINKVAQFIKTKLKQLIKTSIKFNSV